MNESIDYIEKLIEKLMNIEKYPEEEQVKILEEYYIATGEIKTEGTDEE